MRRQVTSANLSKRLANSWRGDVYPKHTSNSINAAGHVYTRAHYILNNFEEGTTIRSKNGLWLAIPDTQCAAI